MFSFPSSYGIYLAQNLSRLVIKRGYKPFVVIRHENNASKSLYTKLGFVQEFEMARIVWMPFGYVRDDQTQTIIDMKESSNGHYKNGKNGHHVNGAGNDKTNGVNNHEA